MDLHALDHHRLGRTVLGAGLHALDGVDRVHAVGHPPEHGVLAVEPGRRLGRDDEELAAVGVGPGVGHGQSGALDLVVVELVLEGVAGPARAGPVGGAALDHEVLDDPVEDHAVVEAVARELQEVVHRLGRVLVEQLDGHGAVVGVQGGLAHLFLATSARSFVSRTRLPFTLSATSAARSSGTSTKLKRSSTLTLRTSSFSRWLLSTTAATTSAGSRPCALPAPTNTLA